MGIDQGVETEKVGKTKEGEDAEKEREGTEQNRSI